MNKTCNKCGESKPLSEYYANPRAGDNLHLSCKSCHYDKTRLVLLLKKGLDPMFLDYLAVAEWRMGSTVYVGKGNKRKKR